jgi:heme/copper-type cytochrome/quinol oxidase subunit 2
MDPLVLQDPVAYTPLPSAPPADTVVTVRPEPLTIRLVSVHTAAPVAENRKWLTYCCFIILVAVFVLFAFYYMMFGAERKN